MLQSKKLHLIILCILLIIPRPTKSNFDLTPLQLNIIICITSCCIGATLYALIQKYFYTPPNILPTQNNQKTAQFPEHPFQKQCQNNFKKINNQMQIGYNNQKEIVESLMQQNNTINTLRKKINILNKKIERLQQKNSEQREADQTLYNELDNFCKTNNTIIPVICACYWAHKSLQQDQKLATIKLKLENQETK